MTGKIEDGGPAFPQTVYFSDGSAKPQEGAARGISVRDYFAAAIDIPWNVVEAYALEKGGVSYKQMHTWRAQMRYAEADAMLAARRQS